MSAPHWAVAQARELIGTPMIYVDVDASRARAFYERGLKHLDAAWPQLMEIAREKDAAHDAMMARMAADREAAIQREKAKYQQELEQYLADKAEFLQWELKPSMFRGPKPREPIYPYEATCAWGAPRDTRRSAVTTYKTTRYHMESKRNMASAAVGLIRMSEADANWMIRLGTGEAVAEMLTHAKEMP